MVSENTVDEQPDQGSRERRGGLRGLLFRVIRSMFGEAVETPVESEGQDGGQEEILVSEPEPEQVVAEAAQVLEEALEHFESILERLEDQVQQQATAAAQAAAAQEIGAVQQALEESFQRLGDALGQLGVYVQRLSDEASGLRLVESRLEDRLDELTHMLSERRPPIEREEGAREEPRFWPNEKAVGIVLAEVPGFQGLMDAQRALSDLQEAERASVVRYRNGEASLELTLRAPVSARRIVEELRQSTGHELLIEEARPDALRLRLRFVDREGRG